MNEEPNYDRILANIASCREADKLITFFTNAQKKNVAIVKDAALLQLQSLVPKASKGSFEDGFWNMFKAYQEILLASQMPTIKLNEAFKAALTEGETGVLEHWVEKGAQVWAFQHLMNQNRSSETAEGLVLAFPSKFSPELRDKAKKRIALAKI